jgi:putative glycosyltransferase
LYILNISPIKGFLANNSMKSRHYIYLMGGLGNQLYILAYAYFLTQQQQNEKISILIPRTKDKGDSTDKAKRNIITELPKQLGFSIVTLSPKKITYLFAILKRMLKIGMQKTFFGRFIRIYLEPRINFGEEERQELLKNQGFHPDLGKTALFNFHLGYYSSHKYTTDTFCKKTIEILEQLSPKTKFVITENDVAIHVRRGDFFTNGNDQLYNFIGTDFYLEGLNKLNSYKKIEKVYIFSDEFENIKNEIEAISNNYPIVLVENQSVLEDLNLMTKFNNFVIGNSTFAYWGATLAKAQNIIVPKNTFKFDVGRDFRYFDHWTILDNKII